MITIKGWRWDLVLICVLIACAAVIYALSSRYTALGPCETVRSGSACYVLDRWTGDVHLIALGTVEGEFRRRRLP